MDVTQNKLDDTQKLLDDTVKDLKVKAKSLEKLERKYVRDEEELKRSLLLLDGIFERDYKRPMVAVQALLSDLDITFKDGDIKSAYRIGASLKGEIFKNISKLKQKETRKGLHLNDALSPKSLKIFVAFLRQGRPKVWT